MDTLAEEIARQKDQLEAAPRVEVRTQELAVAFDDIDQFQGCVEVYATAEQEVIRTVLDVYDQDGSYKIEAQELDGDWEDSFRRYTIPDVLVLLSSLVHRITGTREVELDTDHWPDCRVVLTQHHLTSRSPYRTTSTVLFRGGYFECLDEVRERVAPDGLPTDIDIDIRGEIPPKHTVEDPPTAPDWLRADPETEPDQGEVELPF